MPVFDVLEYNAYTLLKLLDKLIASFDKLDNTRNLEKAMEIFDDARSYININENMLYPLLLRSMPNAQPLLDKAKNAHEAIEETIEKSTMIHVDEPSNEFKENMKTLKRQMQEDFQYHLDVIFPAIQKHVPSQELVSLSERINSSRMQVERMRGETTVVRRKSPISGSVRR